MTGGNAPFVYCANAFSLGVEAINDPMGSDQRPWWVPTLRVCPALKGREGHGDPGEWWEMIPTLPAPQWTPLTIALFMYTCPKWTIEIQEYYRTPIATAHSSGKKPPAAFRTAFLQYISDSGSFEKEKGDTWIYHHPHKRPHQPSEGRTDRNSSGAYVCVTEQYYSTVFISHAFN